MANHNIQNMKTRIGTSMNSSLRAQRGNPRRWNACTDRHGLRPRDDGNVD